MHALAELLDAQVPTAVLSTTAKAKQKAKEKEAKKAAKAGGKASTSKPDAGASAKNNDT